MAPPSMASLSMAPPPAAHSSVATAQTIALTPVRKRRARVSWSPIRDPNPSPSPAKRFPKSVSQNLETNPPPKDDEPTLPLSTSSLEFSDFSFWGKDGSLLRKNVSSAHRAQMEEYLIKHFGMTDIWYMEPYLLIGCDPDLMPPEEDRPFTVAGLVAIWRPHDEMDFHWVLGEEGGAEEATIDPAMLEQIHHREIIPDDVVLYLQRELFPTAEAITQMWSSIIVELPYMELASHYERLNYLPRDIDGAPIILRYYNGPLPNSPRRKREVQPEAKYHDGACDETDYVALDQKLYPGGMVSSVDAQGERNCSVTAGILVEKEGEKRLTCSFHAWDNVFAAHADKFGGTGEESRRLYKVRHGANPGTDIGYLVERFGKSDVALAKLLPGIKFDNKLMQVDAIPKTFVASKDQNMGDSYLIESWVTGVQKLVGLGARRAFARRGRNTEHEVKLPNDMKHLGPDATVMYIAARQGVFTTNTPIIKNKPYIRDGVCGAVLIRIKDTGNRGTEEATMARGEVAGMMHFADIQLRTFAPENYFIYADSFDPLIKEGWTIVQEDDGGAKKGQSQQASPVQVKRKASPQDGPGTDDKEGGDGHGGSSKKQKL